MRPEICFILGGHRRSGKLESRPEDRRGQACRYVEKLLGENIASPSVEVEHSGYCPGKAMKQV